MKTLKLAIENYEFEVPVFEKEGASWVALRPICEILGVKYERQFDKVVKSKFINHLLMGIVANERKLTLVA